ncbi:response regulator [Pseudomonas sp.]|uniref:response regulator n=1 Tax=Pseudomonas sp. TaxID=306 RepID=UPI0028AB623C|nr:response regulator [Pseudomonas sp.]
MKELRSVEKITRPTVLLVEDEPMIRELLTLYLEDLGAVVTAVATADDGNDKLRRQDWTLLLTDVQTPGLLNGIDLAWMTSQEKPQTRIIVMSGYYELAGSVLPPGAQFLPKPWPITRLQELLCAQLSHAGGLNGPCVQAGGMLEPCKTFANKAQ